MIDIISDDSGSVLLEATSKGIGRNLYPLIKTADLQSSHLIKEAFADPVSRLFPLDTLSNVAASAVYMTVQADEVPELVKQACNEALVAFGIDYEVPTNVQQDGELDLNKTAELEVGLQGRFVLEDRQKLPVLDSNMLKKSASAFFDSLSLLSIDEVVGGAQALSKFAYEYGLSEDEVHEKLPVYTLSSPSNLSKVASAIMTRKAALLAEGEEGTDYDGVLQKLAEERIANGGDISYDERFNLEILADIVSLDKVAGISKEFNPIEDVFNFQAVKEEPLVKVAQEEIEQDILYGATRGDIVKVAGEAVADAVCEGNSFSYEKFAKERDNLHEDTVQAILGK